MTPSTDFMKETIEVNSLSILSSINYTN